MRESHSTMQKTLRRTGQNVRHNWPFYLRLAAILLVMGAILVGIRLLGVERLQAIIDQFGIFAPLVYIALRALLCVFPLGAGPVQLASGVLFGFVPALIYSVVGSTLGYSISFWIARRYGRDVVKRLLGDNIEQVEGYISRLDSFTGLVVARLALYFAYDFVAYAAGLSQTKFWRFALVTLVVGIPPVAFTIAVGLFGAGGLF